MDLDNGRTIDPLAQLTPGLSPQEVCQTFFEACASNDPQRWLAAIHLELRLGRLGPFYSCNWDLGRARVEKYRVFYELISESKPILEGTDPMVTLLYQPLYGPVPGYESGLRLGNDVMLKLKKEGGERGEWRVSQGAF